jgi:hypothetical protein
MLEVNQIGSKPAVEYFNARGVTMITIPYNIVEISPGVYAWKDITINGADYNYDGIVNALITIKYSPAAMTAIINNYLLDPNNEDTNKEFIEMQEYRKYAKETAKQILTDK